MCAKWGEETTLKFVELYRDEECLWNSKLGVYKNKQAREAALKRITTEVGIQDLTISDIKTKIKNLRSTYAQEVAKVRKSQSSGSGADEIYIPKMKWFAIMNLFLKNIDKRRTTSSNLEIHVIEVHQESEPLQHEIEEISHKEIPLTNQLPNNESKDEIGEPTPKRPKAAKGKMRQVAACIKDLNLLATSIESMDTSENEFDIFGRSVAAQLKTMPLPKAIDAQNQVQQLLTRLRLLNMESTCSSMGSSSCSSTYTNYENLISPEINETYMSSELPTPLISKQSYENSSMQLNSDNVISQALNSSLNVDTDEFC